MQKQMIGVRLDKETIEKIKNLAIIKKRTPSNLIRVIVENYLEQLDKI